MSTTSIPAKSSYLLEYIRARITKDFEAELSRLTELPKPPLDSFWIGIWLTPELWEEEKIDSDSLRDYFLPLGWRTILRIKSGSDIWDEDEIAIGFKSTKPLATNPAYLAWLHKQESTTRS